MTNAELADQIERWLADDPDHMGLHSLSEAQWRGIIVALRRQPPETLKAAYFEGYEDALKDRQPSSDQVLVPGLEQAAKLLRANGFEKSAKAIQFQLEKLSAAEAEGRKS